MQKLSEVAKELKKKQKKNRIDRLKNWEKFIAQNNNKLQKTAEQGQSANEKLLINSRAKKYLPDTFTTTTKIFISFFSTKVAGGFQLLLLLLWSFKWFHYKCIKIHAIISIVSIDIHSSKTRKTTTTRKGIYKIQNTSSCFLF